MGIGYKTLAEFQKLVVDHSDNDVTIYPAACLLRKIMINETFSANAVTIDDGTSAAFVIPASTAAGSDPDYGDVLFTNSLIVKASSLSQGNMTVIYKPSHEGLAGDGA